MRLRIGIVAQFITALYQRKLFDWSIFKHRKPKKKRHTNVGQILLAGWVHLISFGGANAIHERSANKLHGVQKVKLLYLWWSCDVGEESGRVAKINHSCNITNRHFITLCSLLDTCNKLLAIYHSYMPYRAPNILLLRNVIVDESLLKKGSE